jgi:DMSO/TMAO reductase YedYZ molybdopterin-dependent catalytic subunit
MGAHLLECAGNSRAAHFGFISVARWSGVPLQRVLDRAGRAPGATRVLVSGFDEHATAEAGSVPGASWIFSLEDVRQAGAFLATGMNDGPLSPDHGHPLRLVVPGWYGCTAIKWVNEIALVGDDAPATDHMREYAGRTHQDAAGPELARAFRPATLDPAATPVRVEQLRSATGDTAYRVVGIFWGAPADPRALRIRFVPGADPAPVEHVRPRADRTWTLWSHTWKPRAPGRYRIELAMPGAGVRTRRLDAGYYAREVEIART